MKKVQKLSLPAVMMAMLLSLTALTACDQGETYADMKEREKDAINAFLADNPYTGPINVISEATFNAQGCTTNLDRNEFVVFSEDGIYLQIVRQGEGKSLAEMADENAEGKATKPILCRFLEYDIKNAAQTISNYNTESVVDEMQCTYVKQGRSYTANFVSGGYMYAKYGSVVPKGWLKPLTYVKLTKVAGREAKVRVIVPHTSGSANASSYVLPFYYEITYQLPANR